MNKYRNQPTEVDGYRFASKAEAARYSDLKLLKREGEISDLRLQPRYPIAVGGVKIGTYIADFAYVDSRTGETVVEDVKGVQTPVFKLKRKLVEALYPGITITIVRPYTGNAEVQ